MNLLTNDFFGMTIAAILTLFVYSYLLRDNPLYKLAEHLLVATGVAYALVVAVYWVLIPKLFEPLQTNATNRPDLLIPLVLGLLLLAKAMPRGSKLGNPSTAYLIGVGLALAMGGALVGTLIPQAQATMLPIVPLGNLSLSEALSNLILIVGTLAVLFSFFYLKPQIGLGVPKLEQEPTRPPTRWYTLGRWFMMITFGTIFGGMTLTYISLLVGRWDFLINEWLAGLLGF